MMNLASIDIGSNGARLLINASIPRQSERKTASKNSCSSASHCDWVRMYSPWERFPRSVRR